MSYAGILNVLKAPGPSSHDVVARLRRILGMRQIGHGGTLDPGAAGVLPILVGRATKLSSYLLEHPKAYRAEMTLGIATDTQDASGKTLSVATDLSVPPAALGDAMAGFLGEIEQIPPMASALKHQGRRLYELAREGRSVERAPRSIHIHSLHVRAVFPTDTERLLPGTRVLFDVSCSRGTYVRTLCHDIGERLGLGAHMSFLVRTAVGPFRLEESHTLDEIAARMAGGELESILLPMESALSHLPRVLVPREEADRLRAGQALPKAAAHGAEAVPAGALVRVAVEGEGLVCVGRLDASGRTVQPVRVVG